MANNVMAINTLRVVAQALTLRSAPRSLFCLASRVPRAAATTLLPHACSGGGDGVYHLFRPYAHSIPARITAPKMKTAASDAYHIRDFM